MTKPVKRAATSVRSRASKRSAAPSPSPAKRRYDSSNRQAMARQTQQHIAEVARDLFIEQGYTATSIRDIADRAEVAVQTIYNAFDGKPAIVARIADMAVVGDDAPIALDEREEIVELMQLTDPVELIERWSRFATGIYVRMLPILPALREAVGSEPTVAAQWRTNAVDNRYAGNLALARRLEAIGGLRDGLSAEEAADVVWGFVSFDTGEALIVERGWTAEAFAAWIARLLTSTLLP